MRGIVGNNATLVSCPVNTGSVFNVFWPAIRADPDGFTFFIDAVFLLVRHKYECPNVGSGLLFSSEILMPSSFAMNLNSFLQVLRS